jgi:midasin (ATPase involved in ribosome maturation)
VQTLAQLTGHKLIEFPMSSDTDTMDIVGSFQQVCSDTIVSSNIYALLTIFGSGKLEWTFLQCSNNVQDCGGRLTGRSQNQCRRNY